MTNPKDAFNELTRRGGKRIVNVKQLSEVIGAGIAETIRRLELTVMQTLPAATPVDTGFARGKWTPTVGAAATNITERPGDEGAARSQGAAALEANKAKAKSIASTYLVKQGSVFITNTTPYVVFLDQGSSSQAPANFVSRAVQDAIASVSVS